MNREAEAMRLERDRSESPRPGWFISGILASILMTGLSSWFAFGRDSVTEKRVNELIETRMGIAEQDSKVLAALTAEFAAFKTSQVETNQHLKDILTELQSSEAQRSRREQDAMDRALRHQ